MPQTCGKSFGKTMWSIGRPTHLVSPEMAAAAAIAGHFCDVGEWLDV
jgi:homoaconitase/3-isopropylmalate dehydratase large subunit